MSHKLRAPENLHLQEDGFKRLLIADTVYNLCNQRITKLATDADKLVKNFRKTCRILKARLQQLETEYIQECERQKARQRIMSFTQESHHSQDFVVLPSRMDLSQLHFPSSAHHPIIRPVPLRPVESNFYEFYQKRTSNQTLPRQQSA